MPNRSRSASFAFQWLDRRNTVRRASHPLVSETRPSSSAGESLTNSSQAVDDSTLAGPSGVPISPPPGYTELALDTNVTSQPAVVVHIRELSPVSVGSVGSLPDYESVPPGPPTDHVGYYNYVVPGMEVGQANSGTDNLSFWIPMPFVTNPTLPFCDGMQDGSCPLAVLGPHNSGPYYQYSHAPSAVLLEGLAQRGVEYLFEGSNPPEELWQASFSRALGEETEESEDLLFRFRWYHCPHYRARVIARRQRLSFRRSEVWLRRQRRGFLREIGALPDRIDLSPIEDIEEAEARYVREADARYTTMQTVQESQAEITFGPGFLMHEGGEESEHHWSAESNSDGEQDINSSPIDLDDFLHNSALEISIDADSEGSMQTTELVLPGATFDYRTAYLRYGFIPPSVPGPSHWAISPYLRCLSPQCPLAHIAHFQGPWLDPGPFGHPMMLGTGPEVELRSQLVLGHCQDRLRDLGIGALFGESVPPLEVWCAVTRITEYDPRPGDVELVERFRYYHVLGGRCIVGESEEYEDPDTPILIDY